MTYALAGAATCVRAVAARPRLSPTPFPVNIRSNRLRGHGGQFRKSARQIVCSAGKSSKDNKPAEPAPSAPAGTAKPLPQIEFDISKLVRYNFWAQVVLSGVSWVVIFLTTHISMAKGAEIPVVPTLILMISVALSAYSALLSFGYFKKVSEKGVEVLEGYKTMDGLFEHLNLNFAGAVLGVVALQAAVGKQITQSLVALSKGAAQNIPDGGSLGLECLTQAASNTIAAHLVSILFLALLIRKISHAYKKLVEWSDKIKQGMPSF